MSVGRVLGMGWWEGGDEPAQLTLFWPLSSAAEWGMKVHLKGEVVSVGETKTNEKGSMTRIQVLQRDEVDENGRAEMFDMTVFGELNGIRSGEEIEVDVSVRLREERVSPDGRKWKPALDVAYFTKAREPRRV